MSARLTVLLGLGILSMVLLGTLTVGRTPAFYAILTAVFAVVAGVLLLFGRGSRPGGY